MIVVTKYDLPSSPGQLWCSVKLKQNPGANDLQVLAADTELSETPPLPSDARPRFCRRPCPRIVRVVVQFVARVNLQRNRTVARGVDLQASRWFGEVIISLLPLSRDKLPSMLPLTYVVFIYLAASRMNVADLSLRHRGRTTCRTEPSCAYGFVLEVVINPVAFESAAEKIKVGLAILDAMLDFVLILQSMRPCIMP